MDAYNQMNAAAQKGSISSDDFDIHLQQLSARYNISILVLDEDSETIRVSGGDPAILKIELWNHVLLTARKALRSCILIRRNLKAARAEARLLNMKKT